MAERTSSHEAQGPQCAKDPSTAHRTRAGGTGSQVVTFVAHMQPEMQPPASTLGRKMITISMFVLVEGRKRRDSNPRCLSARSLSRRMGTMCWSVRQAAYLRLFFQEVCRSVEHVAVGCYR